MNTRVAYRDNSGQLKVRISVLEELFHFVSMDDWIASAQLRFRNYGHTAQTAICVDSDGTVCLRGKQFNTARYPVRVYAVDEAPYKPSGMLGERQPTETGGEL